MRVEFINLGVVKPREIFFPTHRLGTEASELPFWFQEMVGAGILFIASDSIKGRLFWRR